jgi:hypothetical protein
MGVSIMSKFAVITQQKETITKLGTVAAKVGTTNMLFTLRGYKLSDRSLFVKSFATYEIMEQWLTTFEADQYNFG